MATKIVNKRQVAALEGLLDAFLPDELRPKRRSRGRMLRRVGGLALVALVGVAIYAGLRRAGE